VKNAIRSSVRTLAVVLLAVMPLIVVGAPPVQVNAADPSSAPQGTISLDVTVSGSGFDSSAQVEFLVTGTTNPGGVIVRNVTVTGPKKLVATIDVAETAVVAQFDVEVRLSGGRKGKGTTLFAVLAKANDSCIAAVDFPSFIFVQDTGQQGTYVSDRSGQCRRFLMSGLPSSYTRLSYPVRDDLGNATNRGRVAWFGRDPADTFNGPRLQYHAMDFEIVGTTISPGPIHLIVDYGQLDSTDGGGNNGVCCGLDLSADGRDIYLPTKAELRPAGYVNKVVHIRLPADLSELDPGEPPLQTVVFEHQPGPRNDTEYATDLDVNAAGDFLFVKQTYGQYAGHRVVRVDLDPDLTDTGSSLESVVVASPPPGAAVFVGADVSSAASDLIAVVHTSVQDNCNRLKIINGRTGTVLNEGAEWPGWWVTWAHGKVITAGFRKGCRASGALVSIDPTTGQVITLLDGRLPDGR
jgi:hypothetical protein